MLLDHTRFVLFAFHIGRKFGDGWMDGGLVGVSWGLYGELVVLP